MYEAEPLLPQGPDGSDLLMGQVTDRKKLIRHEHACAVATCCAFLDEDLEGPPGNRYEKGYRVVVFGPSLSQT